MKKRVNITLKPEVLEAARKIQDDKKISSFSELVERLIEARARTEGVLDDLNTPKAKG